VSSLSIAVPTTHARSSGHQVRRTAPVPPRGACLRRTGQARRVNRHPMPCLVDRLGPCALRLAGVRKARDPDCEVHNLGDRRTKQQVGAFGQVQLRQRGPLSGSPGCPFQSANQHRLGGRGTAVVVFMVKDEDVRFIRRRHDVTDPDSHAARRSPPRWWCRGGRPASPPLLRKIWSNNPQSDLTEISATTTEQTDHEEDA
jgi:hypothetical protein